MLFLLINLVDFEISKIKYKIMHSMRHVLGTLWLWLRLSLFRAIKVFTSGAVLMDILSSEDILIPWGLAAGEDNSAWRLADMKS